jgi:hypothetical protein
MGILLLIGGSLARLGLWLAPVVAPPREALPDGDGRGERGGGGWEPLLALSVCLALVWAGAARLLLRGSRTPRRAERSSQTGTSTT